MAVLRVATQVSSAAPGDVSEVQQGDAVVAFLDGAVQLPAAAHRIDEIGDVRRIHPRAAAADGVRGVHHFGALGLLDDFSGLVVDDVVVAIQQGGAWLRKTALRGLSEYEGMSSIHAIKLGKPLTDRGVKAESRQDTL